jgi:hypothetical protein
MELTTSWEEEGGGDKAGEGDADGPQPSGCINILTTSVC